MLPFKLIQIMVSKPNPPQRNPPELAGLIKGLLTVGFP